MSSLRGFVERLPLPVDAALNLAVFRIVVAALFLTTGEIHGARGWARLPRGQAFAPRGWAWALDLFPARPDAAAVAYVVLIGAAILGLVGLYARPAFALLTVASLYLLALPVRSGLPVHYHHLVWFAALCAASPCADAAAIGVWLRRRGQPQPASEPAPSAAYALPLRAAWVLIGVIFFFPGLWKLRAAGLAWITGDYLRDHLWWRWSVTPGWQPLFRLDRHPFLLHATAAGVVAFELSFVFLLWNRWSRRVAIAAALVFHAGARWLMGIDFSGLWLTYVAFIDWDGLERWARRRTGRHAPRGTADAAHPSPRGVGPALVVGAVLIAGAIEAGARGAITGWPFACYPTFHDRAPKGLSVLAMTGLRPDGTEVVLDPLEGLDASQAPRVRVMDARLIAAARSPDGPARFAERWRQQRARTAASAAQEVARDLRAVRFYGAWRSTEPEDGDRPARLGALLYELPLD